MEEKFTPYDYGKPSEQLYNSPEVPKSEALSQTPEITPPPSAETEYKPYSYTYGEQKAKPVEKENAPVSEPAPQQTFVRSEPYPVQYGIGYKKEEKSSENAAQMTAVQPNGIPVIPRKEEKKYIKKIYNITGWMLIINSVLPVILAVMFGLGYGLYTEFNGGLPYGMDRSIQVIAMVLIYVIADFFVVLLGNKITGIKLTPLFNTKGFSASFLFMGMIIAIGMNLSAIIVSSLTETAVEELFGIMLVAPDDTPSSMMYMIVDCIYAVLVAPIIEEIVFRGFVLKNFSRYNVYTGIVLSGLFFGLMHGNFYQFIFTTPFGIALAYMTVKSNSILPAIFTHFVANAGVTAISLIGLYNEDLSDGIFVVWLAFFICVGFLMLFIGLASKTIRLPKNTKAEKKRGFPLAFTSHAVIIYIVIGIISCITSFEKM